MIHFFDPSNEKIAGEAARDRARRPTSCSATSRTRSRPTARRPRARGSCGSGSEVDLGGTALWTRVNSLDSPWVLDDLLAARRRDRRPARRDHGPEGRGAVGHPLRRPAARAARGAARAGAADPRARDPRDRARRHQRRGDRRRLAAHAGHELRPGRPRRLAAHEDDARRRRPSRLRRCSPTRTRSDPDAPRARRAAGPLALLDRAHGRRLRGDRHPARSTGRSATSPTSPAARRSSAPRS